MSRHREVFEEFAEKAENRLGDSLKKMILYGSVARGEETQDSDIDVFAVVKTKEDLDRLREMAYEIGVLENAVTINVQGKTSSRFHGFESNSYLRKIGSEGIEFA
jgi:predicted nucleotidyltransferase